MKRPGFTIVELAIVLVIMAILLTLAVVNVRGSQVQARDNERHADIEAIANTLESYYDQNTGTVSQSYPPLELNSTTSTVEIGSSMTDYIVEKSDQSALIPPEGTGSGLVAATNTTQTTVGIEPQPTIDTYVYQPLTPDGATCLVLSAGYTQHCTRFNLYYALESPTDECPAPTNICMKRSVR